MKKRFDRTYAVLPEIARFVQEYFSREGIGTEHLQPVQLAVEEIFTNMVKYTRGSLAIQIGLRRTAGELVVSLTDFDVEPFDIRTLPDVDVTAPLEKRKPGGLGIHLVKRFMDRVEFTYENRCGTTTVFRRVE